MVEPGACGGVDGTEPGVCDEVEGVEPGVCCGGMGGAGDVLLGGGIFNGYWFPSVSLKHKVSSSKPYCFLNHNAFLALLERDSNLRCTCHLESVVISLVNICLSSTLSLCSFSNFLICFFISSFSGSRLEIFFLFWLLRISHVSSSKTFYFSLSRFSYFFLRSSTSTLHICNLSIKSVAFASSLFISSSMSPEFIMSPTKMLRFVQPFKISFLCSFFFP